MIDTTADKAPDSFRNGHFGPQLVFQTPKRAKQIRKEYTIAPQSTAFSFLKIQRFEGFTPPVTIMNERL